MTWLKNLFRCLWYIGFSWTKSLRKSLIGKPEIVEKIVNKTELLVEKTEFLWYESFEEDDDHHRAIAALEKNDALENMLNKMWVYFTIQSANGRSEKEWQQYKHYKNVISLIKFNIKESVIYLEDKKRELKEKEALKKYQDETGLFNYDPTEQGPDLFKLN